MKTPILVILALASLNAGGQNHFFGIKGGSAWTNNTTNYYSQYANHTNIDKKYRAGFSGGLTYEYILNKNFSLGVDLLYDQRGFINSADFKDSDDTTQRITNHYKINYFSIPVRTGFRIGKKAYGFANIGLVPAILLDAQSTTAIGNSDGSNVETEAYNLTENTEKFDFAGFVEIGAGYTVKRSRIFTSFIYQQSFTTYYLDTYFNFVENRHYGMNLSVGLQYALARQIQRPPDPSHTDDNYYLDKSRSQKKLALIVLIGGVGIAAAGGVAHLVAEGQQSDVWSFNFTGAWMAIFGGITGVSSTPIFISSAVNARKAIAVQ